MKPSVIRYLICFLLKLIFTKFPFLANQSTHKYAISLTNVMPYVNLVL